MQQYSSTVGCYLSLIDWLMHRYLSIHIERVMCEAFLRHVMYRLNMGIVKARKLGLRSKIFSFSNMVQDYGNRSADICLVLQASWALSL